MMFWQLVGQTSGRKISFVDGPKEAVRRMLQARRDYKEEFKLYGRNLDAEPLVEISDTSIYP